MTEVPPLEMVDDILTVSKFSLASVTINADVNSFIESNKLTLSKKNVLSYMREKAGGIAIA